MGFLDDNGLSYVWAKMKSYVTQNAGVASTAAKLATARAIDGVLFDGSEARHHYGKCTTIASNATKTCNIAGFTLVAGARVVVQFTVANTAENPMLNISGTGAKQMYYKGSPIPKNYITAETVLELVYDGSYWRVAGDLTRHLLETIISPVELYTSSTGIYATAVTTWKYTTISGLSGWKEVRMFIEAGDGERGYRTFTRGKQNSIVSGFASANYNGCMEVTCDFANNRVGVYVKNTTGWALSSLRVLKVEGLARN